MLDACSNIVVLLSRGLTLCVVNQITRTPICAHTHYRTHLHRAHPSHRNALLAAYISPSSQRKRELRSKRDQRSEATSLRKNGASHSGWIQPPRIESLGVFSAKKL